MNDTDEAHQDTEERILDLAPIGRCDVARHQRHSTLAERNCDTGPLGAPPADHISYHFSLLSWWKWQWRHTVRCLKATAAVHFALMRTIATTHRT